MMDKLSDSGRAKKVASVGKSVTLKATDALPQDIGRSFARIDPSDLTLLGVELGELLEISGKRKTVVRFRPTMPEHRGHQKVYLDPLMRENAGAAVDQTVEVRRAYHSSAQGVTLAVTTQKVSDCDPSAIQRYLDNTPVMVGDRVRVPQVGGKSFDFLVADTLPIGAVVISPATRVKLCEPIQVVEVPAAPVPASADPLEAARAAAASVLPEFDSMETITASEVLKARKAMSGRLPPVKSPVSPEPQPPAAPAPAAPAPAAPAPATPAAAASPATKSPSPLRPQFPPPKPAAKTVAAVPLNPSAPTQPAVTSQMMTPTQPAAPPPPVSPPPVVAPPVVQAPAVTTLPAPAHLLVTPVIPDLRPEPAQGTAQLTETPEGHEAAGPGQKSSDEADPPLTELRPTTPIHDVPSVRESPDRATLTAPPASAAPAPPAKPAAASLDVAAPLRLGLSSWESDHLKRELGLIRDRMERMELLFKQGIEELKFEFDRVRAILGTAEALAQGVEKTAPT